MKKPSSRVRRYRRRTRTGTAAWKTRARMRINWLISDCRTWFTRCRGTNGIREVSGTSDECVGNGRNFLLGKAEEHYPDVTLYCNACCEVGWLIDWHLLNDMESCVSMTVWWMVRYCVLVAPFLLLAFSGPIKLSSRIFFIVSVSCSRFIHAKEIFCFSSVEMVGSTYMWLIDMSARSNHS